MKIGTDNAFPLLWPRGRPRTPAAERKEASFTFTLAGAREEVLRECRLMGASYITVSSNLSLKRDGLPYGNQPNPRDPGIAVYFHVGTTKYAMSCDRWTLIEDNLHAIGLSIGAMRGLDRWGSGDMVKQAFSGFEYKALPAAREEWKAIFGDLGTLAHVKKRYRVLAAKAHPDHGGSENEMQRLNAALAAAKKELT